MRERPDFPSRLALFAAGAVAIVASAAMFAPRFAALRAASADGFFGFDGGAAAGDPVGAALPSSTSASAAISASSASVSAREPDPPLAPYVKLAAAAGACPDRMRLIEGVFCPNVGHVCERAAPRDEGDADAAGSAAKPICDDFGSSVLCDGRLERLRYCIDTFEYPNAPGAKPVRATSFRDAQRACANEGKRLCSSDEWAFACEGTRMWPYPYGAKREPTACNVEGKAPAFTAGANVDAALAALETERADGRVKSGERGACVSVFGVFDLPGNVAEWVGVPAGDGTKRVAPARAGGGWARGPGLCRTLERGALDPPREPARASSPGKLTTSSRSEAGELARRAAIAQTGFRCCADERGARPRELLPEKGRGKRPLDLRGTSRRP